MKKIILLFVSLFLGLVLISCSEDEKPKQPVELPLTSSYGIGDQSKLFGMCYLLEQRDYWGSNFDINDVKVEVELMKNLGVKTVRHWMHCTRLMVDKDTLNEKQCEIMHETLKQCTNAGIMNIGMNHHNFNDGLTTVGKIKRSLTKNSSYINWLNDYYTTWFNLVSEFPEVEYWEIDNELNNFDFMFNALDRSYFTATEMVNVSTDMLFYATQAIHDANPKAKSIMGGLTDRGGLGHDGSLTAVPCNPSVKWFLQALYDNIYSGEYGYFYEQETDEFASINPDDYFDCVAWHPYVWDTVIEKQYFIDKNNEIYDIVLENELKHKKVFISEVGTMEFYRGATIQASNIVTMYEACMEMPYVESLMYFKLFDYAIEGAWGGATHENGIDRYGVFYDPDYNHVYKKVNDTSPMETIDEYCINGGPKTAAYSYQQLAGGKGSLDLLVNYYKNKNLERK